MNQALAPAIRFELYPNAFIEIFVIVLENDGSAACLAAAISCSCMALVDAGIELFDTVCAASCAFLAPDMILDPTQDEEEASEGYIVVAYMQSLNQITHLCQVGEISVQASLDAIELLIDSSHKISAVLQAVMAKSLENGRE